jgi:NTP pyrophosphatase (non-canonical NTP hydrolase)
MEINEYQKQAMKTWSKRLTGEQMLINGVMGLCGEAGETIDLVKKHLHQGHELNKERMIEELGDVCWYIAELATYLQVDFSEILDYNIAKLAKRYPEGFSEERSLHREGEEQNGNQN